MKGSAERITSRSLVFAFVLIASLAALPSSADVVGRPSVDRIAALFESVVFGAEIDPRHASTVIAKWQGPIRLAVQGKPKPRHLDFLRQHIATLSRLTGLSIISTKAGEQADIDVIFVPRVEMGKVLAGLIPEDMIRRLAGPGGCYFVAWRKPPERIVRAVIVANTDRDIAEINHCLLEELTQSLGMPNDTDILRPSIFSDHDKLTDLSRSDTIIVRTLYDPRLKAGTPKAEALRMIPAIIGEIDAKLP